MGGRERFYSRSSVSELLMGLTDAGSTSRPLGVERRLLISVGMTASLFIGPLFRTGSSAALQLLL